MKMCLRLSGSVAVCGSIGRLMCAFACVGMGPSGQTCSGE